MGAFDQIINDPKLLESFGRLPAVHQAVINWQFSWAMKAHKHQIEPPGNWDCWLLLAGRGAGKTRAWPCATTRLKA